MCQVFLYSFRLFLDIHDKFSPIWKIENQLHSNERKARKKDAPTSKSLRLEE